MESAGRSLVSKPRSSREDGSMFRTREPTELGAMVEPSKAGSTAYTRTIGPVLDRFTELKVSLEDPSSFRLPAVLPTPKTRGSEVPLVRSRLWSTPDTPPPLYTPKKVYIVEGLDDLFDSALEQLGNSPAVGIKLEGVIKRAGKLTYLSAGTRSAVYIFNIDKLDRAAFKYGLKCILENKNIVKVFHDVRMSSDLLYHQYSVSLVNVFDTAVADVTFFTTVHKEGFMPRFCRSYQSLCIEYLGIPETSLFFNICRTNRLERDKNLFLEMSLDKRKILALSRNCMYLLPLYDICQRAVLYHFQAGTDIFLSTIRDCDNYTAEVLKEKEERRLLELPPPLQEMFPAWTQDQGRMVEQGFTAEGGFVYQDVGDYVPPAIYRL